MSYVKKTWSNGDEVTPEDLNKWETALDEHETGKANKSDIANNLTTTEEGKVLDARQGKELKDEIDDMKDGTIEGSLQKQINNLSNKIDWKSNEWKTESALPSEYPNQQRTVFLSGINNFNGKQNCIVVTEKFNGTLGKQEIYTLGYLNAPTCYRYCVSDSSWGAWQTIATTEKVPFSCTAIPGSGHSIAHQVCYVMCGVAHVKVWVIKTDGSTFSNTVAAINLFSTPYPVSTAVNGIVTTWVDYNNNYLGGGSTVIHSDSRAYAFPSVVGKCLILQFEYPI